jgi:hypothetical protein
MQIDADSGECAVDSRIFEDKVEESTGTRFVMDSLLLGGGGDTLNVEFEIVNSLER